jgi:hypothetical protein
MPPGTAPATVSLCAAPTLEGLRDLTVPFLELELARLAADPLIATESRAPGSLPARAAHWVERVASRAGYLAETIDIDSTEMGDAPIPGSDGGDRRQRCLREPDPDRSGCPLA